MKAIVVRIPDKKEKYFREFLRKNRFKSQDIHPEEDEELIAKWIDKGMESGEISEKVVPQFKTGKLLRDRLNGRA